MAIASESNRFSVLSGVKKFRVRRVLYIAIFWTVIDTVGTYLNMNPHESQTHSVLVREVLVFVMSAVMGYLFVFTLKRVFRDSSIAVNFLAKTAILLVAALLMNFLVHFVDDKFISQLSFINSLRNYAREMGEKNWLAKRTLYWLVLFMVTQLYLEINDKYAPGVFIDILAGKYIRPKVENRIVMFIDLRDSTGIAEKLGHGKYFLFIREFIYHISLALIEYDGIIYQYVGDEIVVSWKYNRTNMRNCVKALIAAQRNIQKHSGRLRREYGIVPVFHVGIHTGDVTVGEIGVIKKDLAMSGDTMNTAARIRSACDELDCKYLVSKDFADKSPLKSWQLENLGAVELKGKAQPIELFALRI